MQKHSTLVALGLAGMVAGIGAGIAAIGNDVADYITTPATPQTEPSERNEPKAVSEALIPTETTPTVEAPVMQTTQTQVALTPVENLAQPNAAPAPVSAPQALTTRLNNDEYYLRVPFTNRQVKVTVPTFPGNSAEFPPTPPSVVAYYDRKNANTVLVGAPGPVFPVGFDSDNPPVSPATIAYFDGLEARRLAAMQQATPPVAAAPPAVANEAVVATVSEGAQSGNR
jgi:hypothetical protein